MDWLKVTVAADPRSEEVVANMLMEAGAQGVEIEDSEYALSQEVPVTWDISEHLDDSAQYAVSAYYAADRTMEQTIAQIEEAVAALKQTPECADLGEFSISSEIVSDADWATAWKQYFKPVRAGQYIVVKPTWAELNADPAQTVIEIDPGMAFGTGNHESTRLCLTLLERFVHDDETVVDVGCGSGVLALAAAKLGAGKVYALDTDRVAVEVTQSNARLNDVGDRIYALQSDLLQGLPKNVRADMVVANIVADVIIRLAPELSKVLRENGMFLCSGIIADRAEDVAAALNDANLRIIQVLTEGDWVGIACKLKRR